MRKLLDSLENAQKAWVDLKKDAKGAHKLFKDYQPEEDLVKREKIIYTGSVKDFVRLTLPMPMRHPTPSSGVPIPLLAIMAMPREYKKYSKK